MYDTLVFIGRFQPFHNGHKAVVDAALERAKEVIIVVGSSFAARNIRNLFTFDERKAMIKAVYPQDNVKVVPVSDYPYDDNKWVSNPKLGLRCNEVYTRSNKDWPYWSRKGWIKLLLENLPNMGQRKCSKR